MISMLFVVRQPWTRITFKHWFMAYEILQVLGHRHEAVDGHDWCCVTRAQGIWSVRWVRSHLIQGHSTGAQWWSSSGYTSESVLPTQVITLRLQKYTVENLLDCNAIFFVNFFRISAKDLSRWGRIYTWWQNPVVDFHVAV